MSIDELLDMMDEVLDRAVNLPLTGGRSAVDADKLRDIIDDIRLNLPVEIKQAKSIVSDRSEIIGIARREADDILKKAQERTRVLVSQDVITKQAQERAAEILAQAQAKAREMKQVSQEFSDNILRQSEEVLAHNLLEVKNARAALRGKRPAQEQQPKGEEN